MKCLDWLFPLHQFFQNRNPVSIQIFERIQLDTKIRVVSAQIAATGEFNEWHIACSALTVSS
jgi:hypothetical protein